MKSKAQDVAEKKRRGWILGLGFSQEEADSFIKFEVPNWKIEGLAEVLHKPEPEPEPMVSELEPEVRDTTEPTATKPPAPQGSTKKAKK